MANLTKIRLNQLKYLFNKTKLYPKNPLWLYKTNLLVELTKNFPVHNNFFHKSHFSG